MHVDFLGIEQFHSSEILQRPAALTSSKPIIQQHMLGFLLTQDKIMRTKLLAITALTSLSCLPLAQAADTVQDQRWYVAPFATFIKSGGDRNASDGWGGGMGFGKMLDKYFNVELRGFYNEFGGTNGPWNLAGGTLDLQYFFTRQQISPYIVLAAGGMNTCASANCGVGLIGEAGVGVNVALTDNLLFRTDVRYRYNNNLNAQVQSGTDEFHDLTVNLGLVIPFGDKPQQMARAEPLQPEYQAPVTQAPEPKIDCATQDADGDNVNDCLDRCASTVQGSKVDVNGCPVKIVLKGEHFQYDSAELTLNARAILDSVAESLRNYPQKNTIEVHGHTSSEGSNAYNQRLSQRRANAVMAYLKLKGVTNKLLTKGFGETQPIADNSTAEGKAENRRVELIWLEY